jgi:type I restriction enzyme S subunit
MREYSFPIPELKAQQRIAKVLHLLDQKIENNRKINDNLQQQAQSYFQELFVDNADPKWTVGTISDLGAVVGGSTPSKAKPEYYTESGIAWITPKDLSINKSKFISHGENDITELGLKNSSASIMPEGTVLFSSRAPIGYIAIAASKVTTNQGFKSVIPKPEIGTPFVYFFLKHNLPVIEGMASGSTFKEVSGNTMKNIPAVIPDAETLSRFNDFCAPLFAQQRVLEGESQSLAALRDSLLPKLMLGEIDLADIYV